MALVPLPTRYGGGLNLTDAPDQLASDEARVLDGWRLSGIGHVTTRRAARKLDDTFTGDPLGVWTFGGSTGVGGILLTYVSAAQKVRLYTLKPNGKVKAYIGTLATAGAAGTGWDGAVATKPVVHACEIGRVFFIVDEGQTYGLTVYDPNGVLGAAALFQPTFDFDGDGTDWGVLKGNLVVEHQNHLITWGYGDEADPSHPELMRFSYLGLIADPHGVGDAGVGGAAGSLGLFDIEDAAAIGTRGKPIVCAASGGDFLVLTNPDRAGVLSGSGYENWRMRWWDGQFGGANSKAIGVARGYVYWLTEVGDIVRSVNGSDPEVLARKVRPAISTMNLDTMFCAHEESEYQIRWYYALVTDTNTIPDRFIGWDYEREAFVGPETLGYRVSCGGIVRLAPIDGPSVDPPAGPPTGLSHDQITSNSARAYWTNGETRPGTLTHVYLAQDAGGGAGHTVPGAYTLKDSVAAGVAAYAQSPLLAGKCYWTKVVHAFNGQLTATLETWFVTAAAATVQTPTGLAVVNSPVYAIPPTLDPPPAISALLSWNLPQTNVKVRVEQAADVLGVPGPFGQINMTAVDATSYRDQDPSLTATTWWYRVTAIDATTGVASAPSAAVSVALTTFL